MPELIRSVATTPAPICLIILGVIFLFLAIGGKLGAQIITDNIKRPVAASIGCFLLAAGIFLHSIPYFAGSEIGGSPDAKKPIFSKSFTLRDKSDNSGPSIRSSQVLSMSNAQILVRSSGENLTGTFSMTRNTVITREVLKRSHGRPVAVREQVVKDETTTMSTIKGKTLQSKENGPLHGQTVLVEWSDGKWKKSLVSTQPTAAQLQELNGTYAEDQEMYPEQPKRPGDSWELNGSQIALFGGLATARSVEGRQYMRFEDVKEHARQQCALISTRGEIQTTIDLNGQELKVSLGGYGSCLRSLSKYYNPKVQFSGNMKIEGIAPVEGGKSAEVTITGPFQIDVIEEEI